MKTEPDELRMMQMTTPRAPYNAPIFAQIPDWLPEERFFFILQKWEERGWWEHGVSLRTGWLTVTGKACIEIILQKENSHV